MLDWFKRIVTPVFHKQLVENENKTLPAAENVERLVDRLGTFSAAASQLAERFTQADVIAVACQKNGSGKSGWRPPFDQRTDYAASMIEGRTVMETVPAGRSAREIAGLWKYVYSQISIRAAA